jgi:hypothetical protein
LPEYEPGEINLFDVLFRWLSGMEGDGVLAATNWNGDLAGREVEPGELRDQLLDAMRQDRAQRYLDQLRVALKQQGKSHGHPAAV